MIGQTLHRFVRNPNYVSGPLNRVGNRSNPLTNTLTVLEDPTNNRKLYLIGTTNASNMLSYRTKALIEKVKPDSVLCQANQKWVDQIKLIQNCDSQQKMNEYNSALRQSLTPETSFLTKLRLLPWLAVAHLIKNFPSDFHPFVPGLEVKFAVEAAQKVNAKLVLAGPELDSVTVTRLSHELRTGIVSLFYRSYSSLNNDLWKAEHEDHYQVLRTQGAEGFAESIDKYRANWFVKYFEKVAPHQKKILVDAKDEDLFYQIFKNCPGNNVVAIVNQWHTQGIEYHWRNATGTQEVAESINPIGDFDIEKYMESQLVNDKLREIRSKLSDSEPATHQNFITHYHKDCQEPERTRHVTFENAQDHHMYHGLPQDSDDAPLRPLTEQNPTPVPNAPKVL